MIKKLLFNLNIILTKKEKKKMGLLASWSIFVSLLEMTVLILILPFIAIASDPLLISSNEYLYSIYRFLEFNSESSFINSLGVLLILLYLIRIFFNTTYLYQITIFSNLVVANIRKLLFDKDIRLLYTEFSSKNISSMSNNIIVESNSIYHIVFPILTIISEGFIFILLITLLLYVNFQVSAILLTFFIINALFILIKFRKQLKINGKARSVLAENNHKIINESFGNYKYLKLSNIENNISKIFAENTIKLSYTVTIYLLLTALPRYIFETLGLIVIVIAILYLNYIGSTVLSTIGIYVISFYRLLPSVNKIITSINSLKFYEKSMDKIIDNLSYHSEDIVVEAKEIDFNSHLSIKDMSFAFNKKQIFKKTNLIINKNDKIAFIGESGSGKSTLVNILTTLIFDIKGHIYIDDIELNKNNRNNWRRKIGYIPQDIYLFDGSVADNVAFGSTEYDEDKIINVLKIAKIYDLFTTKEGLATQVGDNAIQLSGGQKQRLAIARALYGDPEIIVLDEATSALDSITEEEIMNDIYSISKDKTLIIIAHRLSTISKCNRIIKINKGILNEEKVSM